MNTSTYKKSLLNQLRLLFCDTPFDFISKLGYRPTLIQFSCFILLIVSPFQLLKADFSDVTEFSGLRDDSGNLLIRESWGATSCDWNKDGHIDIVLNNHRDEMRLYENAGDGSFIDRTDLLSNPVLDTDEHGIVCADFYPDDGYLEIVVSAGGRQKNTRQYRKFYKYDEQLGKYEDISAALNFQKKNHSGRSLLIADFNGDNQLDLFESAQRKSDRVPPASAAYLFSSINDEFTLMPDELNDACVTKTVFFSRYVDMDGDNVPEIACIGSALALGLFEIDKFNTNNHFNEMWDEISLAKLYGPVKDAVFADFNNDDRDDIFVARRRSHPSNAVLVDGEIKVLLVTKDTTKTFSFSAGDQSLMLDFSAAYLVLNRQIFYGADKIKDPSLKPPWADVQTIQLDPADPKFTGVASSYQDEGLYIGFDGQNWHIRLSSYLGRQEFNGHFFAQLPLTNLALNFQANTVAMQPMLLINNGNGFTDLAAKNGFSETLDNLAVEGGDFDNDGDIDLYLVLSNTPEDYADRYYVNDGSGSFTLKQLLPVVSPGAGENLTVADYDMDGCLDMAVVHGRGGKPNSRGLVQLLQGQCDSINHWIEIDLDGLTPHGLGAKVEVMASGKRYRKLQDGGARRYGQNAQRMHFGLGPDVSQVDISVLWDGTTKTLYPGILTNAVYQLNQDGSYVAINSPPVFLSINDISVNEADGVATFQVVLSDVTNHEVTVNYKTTDDFAIQPDDYIATAGVLTFAPGETTQQLIVQLIDDAEFETVETFMVDLSDAVGASITQSVGKATIRDNDQTVSIDDITVNEADGTASFTVSLSSAISLDVIFDYATSDITAVAGSDYTPANITGHKISAGETTTTIVIPVLQDNEIEVDETLKIILSNVTNASLIDAEGILTIVDDEPLPDNLTVNHASYFPDVNVVWIRVSSDALPVGASIITATAVTNGVETELGEVGWKIGKNLYQQAFRDLDQVPDSIILTSAIGGRVTAVVVIDDSRFKKDTLAIVSAIYYPSDKTLSIKANSDALPAGSAVIDVITVIGGVETTVGQLEWNASESVYQKVFDNMTQQPDSVTLNSDLGGTVSGLSMAHQSSLDLTVTINDLPGEKPGPVLAAGSSFVWKYHVSNDGNTVLSDIEVRGKQKTRGRGDWVAICSISQLQPGEDANCLATDAAISGRYESLISASGSNEKGDLTEIDSEVFYRGE